MDDHREGIQADKPVPPWELPGCFRLDCEPHRGDMLKRLAIAGLIVGQATVCLPFLLVVGIPLSVITWYLPG